MHNNIAHFLNKFINTIQKLRKWLNLIIETRILSKEIPWTFSSSKRLVREPFPIEYTTKMNSLVRMKRRSIRSIESCYIGTSLKSIKMKRYSISIFRQRRLFERVQVSYIFSKTFSILHIISICKGGRRKRKIRGEKFLFTQTKETSS